MLCSTSYELGHQESKQNHVLLLSCNTQVVGIVNEKPVAYLAAFRLEVVVAAAFRRLQSPLGSVARITRSTGVRSFQKSTVRKKKLTSEKSFLCHNICSGR